MPADSLSPGGPTQTTTFTDGATASLVLFQTVGGTRLAWQTTVNAEQDSFVHVIDAQTGRVLYRRSLVDYAEPRPRVGLGVLSERPWAVRGGYAA